METGHYVKCVGLTPFRPRQKDFPSFESNSKGHISPFAILGFFAFDKDFIQ